MSACPSCGTAAPDGAKFCVECGTVLGARCPSCGADAPAGAKFCAQCGTPLAAAAAPTAPVPPPSPTAELRVVSVLFVDLVGYTSLAESRDAEEARELLSRYFEQARTIVGRYGGTIEKFIGDAVMAVWGTPVAQEDDAERAVRAALELVAAVAAFGEEVGAPDLRARAGVVTGQVAALAGEGEGLVVGDRVNTASRVQSTAPPGAVFVDEVTRSASSAAIAYEDAGEHTVKGKAEPIRLFRATRVVAGVGGTQRSQGFEAPFTGRDGELRLVKDIMHQGFERGVARLVAVSGPAGVGKSRLGQEFSNYTDGLAERLLWHSGRCLSYGEGVAYWALAEMVRQRLGISEDASTEEALSKLEVGLERWIVDPAEREYLAPRLGALLGTAQPGLDRQDLFAGWRLFFERLAGHGPVLLVFEDLQWADDGLLDFVEHLLEWSGTLPIFILTFARPELGERRPSWPPARPGVTPVYLEPLPAGAMAGLLDGLVEGLSPAVRDRIVAQAEGVPLYALETVRAFADRGALTPVNGHLRVAGDLGEVEVPATLASLITARLDHLEPDERALVKDMAVFGGSFPRAAAAAISTVPADRLDGLLSSLVRKQVLAIHADPLSPDRGQYTFAQTLLRTVAYDLLSRHERKPRHLAAARHLRSVFSDDAEEVAEVVAAHLLDAYEAAKGDPDAEELRVEALDALRRAARRAEAVGAPEAAERALRTARDLAAGEDERIELTVEAAKAAVFAGRHPDAIALFEEAVAAYESTGRPHDAARLAAPLGEALVRSGQGVLGVERMQAALELLGADTLDPDVAAINARLSFAQTFSGDTDGAVVSNERALRIAAALDLPELVADALATKAVVCAIAGRLEEAGALLTGAESLAARHGFVQIQARAAGNAGDVRLRLGLPADDVLVPQLARDRRRGDRRGVVYNAANLMHVYLLEGRWDDVEEIGASVPAGPAAEPVDSILFLLQHQRGEVEAARATLARFAAWELSDSNEDRLSWQVADALLGVADGDAGALDRLLETTREAQRVEGATSESFRIAWPELVAGLLAAGRLDDARSLVTELESSPPGFVGAYLRGHLARARGLTAAATGVHGEVEAHLRDAVARLEALGYAYWLAVGRTELAAWLGERGRAEGSRALFDLALPVLTDLRAAPALERGRAAAARVPVSS